MSTLRLEVSGISGDYDGALENIEAQAKEFFGPVYDFSIRAVNVRPQVTMGGAVEFYRYDGEVVRNGK